MTLEAAGSSPSVGSQTSAPPSPTSTQAATPDGSASSVGGGASESGPSVLERKLTQAILKFYELDSAADQVSSRSRRASSAPPDTIYIYLGLDRCVIYQ
jgi:hypothetical protein